MALSVRAHLERTHSGTVARIAQVLDHKTRTMGVELDVFHQDPCEIGPPTSGTSGFGPNDELDCPVPRLLLFFGAAKDVPEAEKMVTAGTACLHSDVQAKGQTGHCFRRRYGP